MILAVDVGNTETVVGAFEGREPSAVWRLATDSRRTGDEQGLVVGGLLERAGIAPPERLVVASVVPVLERQWRIVGGALGARVAFLNGTSAVPIRLEVDHPLEVGADRIANTLAAAERFGRDTIVVDLGTATTFDCITGDGAFQGGVIAPGPMAGLDQLTRSTARLPQVQMEVPERVIGKNTLACLASGGFYSVVDGIDGIVRRIVEEWGREEPLVVATGGLAEVVAPGCVTVHEIDPALTISGLAIADRYLFG